MTYEDGGSVHTSKNGERTNADDIIVEQRGAGLISLDRVLKVDVPTGRKVISFRGGSTHRLPVGKEYILAESVGSSGLSDDGEDHGELVGDKPLAPKVILVVEHIAVLESREPDAVQVETPDDHLGVGVETAEERRGRRTRERGGGWRETWIGASFSISPSGARG